MCVSIVTVIITSRPAAPGSPAAPGRPTAPYIYILYAVISALNNKNTSYR